MRLKVRLITGGGGRRPARQCPGAPAHPAPAAAPPMPRSTSAPGAGVTVKLLLPLAESKGVSVKAQPVLMLLTEPPMGVVVGGSFSELLVVEEKLKQLRE